MMAAGQAAERGLRVLLLEKMEKPLRKLRITGKGRCNITNAKAWEEFAVHVFPNNRFFRAAFYNFPNTALMDFFERRGLPMEIERGDRVYPCSRDAFDVAGVIQQWVEQQGVKICCHAEVQHFISNGQHIEAVEVLLGGIASRLTADHYVLATGGLSYPATGSTGDGYRMATETGHRITPTRPSLSGLAIETQSPLLNGVTLRNVELELLLDGDPVDKEFGEMSFNATGIEGPLVLRLSRRAIEAYEKGQKVALVLNMKPAVNTMQLQQRIQNEILELGQCSMETLLRKLLPAALIPGFAATAGLQSNRKVTEMRQAAIEKTLHMLQQWRMPMTGYQGYERAVVTAGGVSLDEIDHKTMRSRIIDNLSFAGELLDLDADTGGYNLQIAFSTGFLAGKMAGKAAKKEAAG